MVPFAGYELAVLYETEWGGIIKGASSMGGSENDGVTLLARPQPEPLGPSDGFTPLAD